jgi:hypothetical protein
MPKDLSKFGTADFMIHPSAIRTIVTCPWNIVLRYLEQPDDESGPAADTGSAVHRAAQLLHLGKDIADSLGGMQEGLAKYPRADLGDAAKLFLAYARDIRNRDARVILCEEPIRFTIEAAQDDPTGEPIQVIGTLDQVREDEWGRLKLYDIKTSKRDPNEIRIESMFQMAAYCVGATVKLGRPVDPGAIIMPRQYKGSDPSTANVFFNYTFKLPDTEYILEPLRARVAEIRRGHVYHMPTVEGCKWCPQRMSDVCLPKLVKLRKELTAVPIGI